MPFTKENAKQYSNKGIEKIKQLRAEGKLQGFTDADRLKGQEVKRQKKAMKDELKTILTISVKRGDIMTAEDILSLEDAKKANITVQTAINIAMAKRAMAGDVQAAQYIRDTVGEKPTDKVQMDQSLTIESWAKEHKVKL